ncbi:MAG: hypothetical protein JRJ85_14970 [Deltaproteobacteria bacterium]|nr:hypothetical protein [Deltaproteobacteria bacterium]
MEKKLSKEKGAKNNMLKIYAEEREMLKKVYFYIYRLKRRTRSQSEIPEKRHPLKPPGQSSQ